MSNKMRTVIYIEYGSVIIAICHDGKSDTEGPEVSLFLPIDPDGAEVFVGGYLVELPALSPPDTAQSEAEIMSSRIIEALEAEGPVGEGQFTACKSWNLHPFTSVQWPGHAVLTFILPGRMLATNFAGKLCKVANGANLKSRIRRVVDEHHREDIVQALNAPWPL